MSSKRSEQRSEQKVVIDTNVLAAAALHPDRVPAHVFNLLLKGEIQNYASPLILEEVKRVMLRMHLHQVLEQYIARTILLSPLEQIMCCSDPDDDKFLECAAAVNAIIITGDRALLEVEVQNIRIMTPQEFLGLI